VTGHVTVTADEADEADEAEVDDDDVGDEAEVLLDEADDPTCGTGVSPNARSYTVAATRLPLAAAVCSTVAVVAVEVR
jgi:hypothetical protein